MADPTAESPASPEVGSEIPATENLQSLNSAVSNPVEVSIRSLMEAGVHFGHQTRRWNPSMKPYLFGERNGVHIVNLDMTLPRFRNGIDFLRETVAGGGKVHFVATKRQGKPAVESHATRVGMPFVSERWLGGMRASRMGISAALRPALSMGYSRASRSAMMLMSAAA